MIRLANFVEWLTSLGGHASPPVKRFLRYTFSGTTSTILDFFLLWFFTDMLLIHYLISGALSFTISVSANYQINHFWGFKDPKRDFRKGYSLFFSFAVIGLLLTIALLAFFVESLGLHYLIARFLAAVFVGFWNYVMNVRFTFKSTLFGK